MATKNFQQNKCKLRKIVKAITDTQQELDESMEDTKIVHSVYSNLLPTDLTSQQTAQNNTPHNLSSTSSPKQ